MPFHVRYIDGDLLCFVHQGSGRLETEFGPLDYRPGDWIYLPKACTWRQLPDADQDPDGNTWLMIEAAEEFRTPPAGPLGRHWPFDPSQACVPEPEPIADDDRTSYEVRLMHRDVDGAGTTSLFYEHHPLDVEGWQGDNFPFTFNIEDYHVVTSASVHLPAMVHLFMAATGVYVCNFLPKPAESVPGTERTPWYHRNVDFDEVAFFHGGTLFGIPMPPGLISHAPQGIHHGAPEKARERARRKFDDFSTVDWKVIAIDTRHRLVPSAGGARRRSGSTRVRYAYDRVPYLVAFDNDSGVRDVYGGLAQIVVLECYLLRPEHPTDTVLVFMHPIGGGAYLPMVNALARAGHHVIYAGSRFRGTDSALVMEKVVEDLSKVIDDAKDRLGYSKVVLAGWSGGGSLSLYYQQQTAALNMPSADGIMLLAAHISRHGTLTEWLDASIVDESDPTRRDPELDLYNPENPNQPPYTAEFLQRYRQAQIARNRRITLWVKQKLTELEAKGSGDEEFCFVVHGTMADPRWLDPTVDPNDREPGTCYLGDPRVVNNSPIGLARFCSLRSWLSQWSYDDARGDGVACGRDIAVPTLVIGNLADDACTPSHTRRLFEAIGHPDKEMHEIAGANHYYSGPDQRETLKQAVDVITDWLARHHFAESTP